MARHGNVGSFRALFCVLAPDRSRRFIVCLDVVVVLDCDYVLVWNTKAA